jgi:hypothetical protein
MRIRVPGRFMAAVAILAVFLCLLPASTKVAVAYPRGWVDTGPTPPGSDGGDNDGVVLKARSAAPPTVASAVGTGSEATRSIARSAPSGLRLFLAVMRLNWSFWLR